MQARQRVAKGAMCEGKTKLTKRKARRVIESLFPEHFAAKRVQNIVRRTLRVTKTKEFSDGVVAVLSAVDRAYDLDQQLTAMNPRLSKGQCDGSIAKERNKAVINIFDRWKTLMGMI